MALRLDLSATAAPCQSPVRVCTYRSVAAY